MDRVTPCQRWMIYGRRYGGWYTPIITFRLLRSRFRRSPTLLPFISRIDWSSSPPLPPLLIDQLLPDYRLPLAWFSLLDILRFDCQVLRWSPAWRLRQYHFFDAASRQYHVTTASADTPAAFCRAMLICWWLLHHWCWLADVVIITASGRHHGHWVVSIRAERCYAAIAYAITLRQFIDWCHFDWLPPIFSCCLATFCRHAIDADRSSSLIGFWSVDAAWRRLLSRHGRLLASFRYRLLLITPSRFRSRHASRHAFDGITTTPFASNTLTLLRRWCLPSQYYWHAGIAASWRCLMFSHHFRHYAIDGSNTVRHHWCRMGVSPRLIILTINIISSSMTVTVSIFHVTVTSHLLMSIILITPLSYAISLIISYQKWLLHW